MNKKFTILLFIVVFQSWNIIYAQQHPHILLLDGEEESLQKMTYSDRMWANLHQDILSECDKMLSLPQLQREKIGMRLLHVSRESLHRIFYLSYAYRMTEEEKYLERAEKEMLTVSNFTDWNPSHFLDVAEMTLGVSIGYDWLYPQLSRESRKIISNAIIQKGLTPSLDKKYNWFLDAKHNWNQVCNAGMVFGALAVYEEDTTFCKSIIDRSIQSVSLPMREYDPDGAYPEGYAYWEYGTSFNVLLLSALKKIDYPCDALSAIPGFISTAKYYQQMVGSTGTSFNYSDCGDESGLTPAMFWFADKSGDSSLLWNEKKYINSEYRDNYLANRLLPAAMIWGSKMPLNQIQAPENLMWTGKGTTPVALMRTSWADENAIYVGLKGGTAGSNHAHMDAGSFVMDADGVRWAMDFGKQDYESLESKKLQIWSNSQDSERWKVFRYNNYVHNTLTVNGKLHNVTGYAPLISSSDNPQLMNAIVDLSTVFKNDLSSSKRGISIVDKRYVVIQDEVEANADSVALIRWSMLTSADVKITGKNKVELKKDGKTLRMEIAGKLPVEIKTWSTQSPNDYDAPNPGTTVVGFECQVPKGKKAFFTVALLPEGAKFNKKEIQSLNKWETK